MPVALGADGAGVRVEGVGPLVGPARSRCSPSRRRSRSACCPRESAAAASGRSRSSCWRRAARRAGVRRDGRHRAGRCFFARGHAGRRGLVAGLPADRVADAAGDPAADGGRLRAGRERGRRAARALLPRALRLDAGRHRRDGGRRLRDVHDLHRRLGRDHHRARRPRLSDPAQGRLLRGLLARPRHGRRARSACSSRRACRSSSTASSPASRDQIVPVDELYIAGLAAGPAARRPDGGLRHRRSAARPGARTPAVLVEGSRAADVAGEVGTAAAGRHRRAVRRAGWRRWWRRRPRRWPTRSSSSASSRATSTSSGRCPTCC